MFGEHKHVFMVTCWLQTSRIAHFNVLSSLYIYISVDQPAADRLPVVSRSHIRWSSQSDSITSLISVTGCVIVRPSIPSQSLQILVQKAHEFWSRFHRAWWLKYYLNMSTHCCQPSRQHYSNVFVAQTVWPPGQRDWQVEGRVNFLVRNHDVVACVLRLFDRVPAHFLGHF